MATALYDKCIVEKLRKWTKNTDLHVYSPDETSRLFSVIADETNDRPLQLPILALRRVGGFTILNTNKNFRSYDGFRLNTDADTQQVVTSNIIPIQLNYQLDIYTRYFEEADAYVRELVFNLMNHGQITVTFNYNGTEFKHRAYIRLEQEVKDNSSITERIVPGQFTRYTISFNLDDALLWNNVIRNTTVIDASGIEIVIVSSDTDIYIESADCSLEEELQEYSDN